MKFPLVLDLAAEGIPKAVTCRVLGFSTQAFHKWVKNPISNHDWDEAHLINAAIDAHGEDPTFGYRFIADELKVRGHVVSENRVHRLCREQQLWSLHAKKKGLVRKAGPPVHDDLVQRTFSAKSRNRVWLKTSPSTTLPKASSTSAQSKTSSPTVLWAMPSTTE